MSIDPKDWNLTKPPAATLAEILTGGGRPDPRHDPKSDLLRQQPQLPQQKTGSHSTASQLLTPKTTVQTPLIQKPGTMVMPRPVAPKGMPPTAQPQMQQSDTAAARQAGADAFLQNQVAARDLKNLANGGVKVQAQVTTPATPAEALQKALIAQLLPNARTDTQTKKTDQPKRPVAQGDQQDPKARVAKDDGKRVQGKTDSPEADANHSATVAQYSGPFVQKLPSEARTRNDQEREIETSKSAAVGLSFVEGGHGIEGVARARHDNPEFSRGYHTVAFGEDDTDALAGRPGVVSGRAVVFDDSSARDLALRLQFSNQILKTPNDRPPVGVLIAQTTDDVPFSLRGGDVQMALSSRRGLYGGIIG